MTPAERLALVLGGYAVFAALALLAYAVLNRRAQLRQGARLDRSGGHR